MSHWQAQLSPLGLSSIPPTTIRRPPPFIVHHTHHLLPLRYPSDL